MIKLLLVAREEITYHLRQWTFYLVTLFMVAVFTAIGALPRLQAVAEETPLASMETVFNVPKSITVPTGYVDNAGLISRIPTAEAANFQAFADEAAAAAALRRGEIESYYVIAADYIASGQVVEYSADPQLLAEGDEALRRLLYDNLLQTVGDPILVERLARPVDLKMEGPPPAEFQLIPPGLDRQRLVSAGLVVGLFTYLINLSGNLLLRSLQREVKAHVLELLVVTTTPAQFIGGKIFGLALLTLVQAGLSLAAALLVYGQNPDGSGPAALPLGPLLLSLPYLLLGFLAFCGAMMGAAAVFPNLPESALLVAAARLLALSPVLGTPFILPNPSGSLAVSLTLLPLTAPLLMPFRLLLVEVPPWQWLLGLLGLAAWAAFSLWASTRLFRVHGLLTGRGLSLKVVWQALGR